MARVAAIGLWCCWVVGAQQEATPTFRSSANLVLVPVVVRDGQGRPVGNLTKDDFRLLDSGRAREIEGFTAVDRGAPAIKPRSAEEPAGGQTAAASEPAAIDPATRRYLIYLFDDIHIRFVDMARVRDAAMRHFRSNLAPGDRAAVFTFSGKPALDFTEDRDKLEGTVQDLRWRPQTGGGEFQCPDVSYYLADLVINKNDSEALGGLITHTAECSHAPPGMVKEIALSAAYRRLILGQMDTQVALGTIRRAIRRLAGMPGQRVIVLASPGFFAQTAEARKAMAEVLDLAARSNVIVNGLSARGVIMAPEEEDVTRKAGGARRTPAGQTLPGSTWMRYRRESGRADGDVMKDLADGTGGTFYRNNNDLGLGLERLTAAPRFSYVLGFSAGELKTDASFHAVKVQLPGKKGFTIEARRGYYALPAAAAGGWATAEVQDSLFSKDQIMGIPVDLLTSYSRAADSDSAMALIAAKIDASAAHFAGNRGTLGVIVGLFDADGAYIAGTAETVKVELADGKSTVTLRWNFEVKPGSYGVRLVVREPESKATTAVNRSLVVR